MPLTSSVAGVEAATASEKVKVTFELLSLSLEDVSAMSIAAVGLLVSIVDVSGVPARCR